MTIERENDTIIIKLDANFISLEDVQRYSDYIRVIESNAKNQGTQDQADELARESQQGWWKENRHRFIK